jgi:hypothetical protein
MTYKEYLELGKPVNNTGELLFDECPSCGDAKGHFYFNRNKGVGHCKKCDYAPNRSILVRDLGLSKYRDEPLLDSIIVGIEDLEAEEYSDDDDDPEEEQRLFVPLPPSAYPVTFNRHALMYLFSRGLSLEEVIEYNLMYCGKGKYAGRIIIPMYLQDGSLAGFIGRGIYTWSSKPKYKFPAGFRKSHILYGIDTIPLGCSNIICVEGPFDRFRVGANSVAVLGKTISAAQMNLILEKAPESVTLLFDSDAKDDAIKTSAVVSHYLPVKVVILPDGEDPGTMPRRTLMHMIEEQPFVRSLDWNIAMLNGS